MRLAWPIALVAFVAVLLPGVTSSAAADAGPVSQAAPPVLIPVYASGIDEDTRIGLPLTPSGAPLTTQSASFIINYGPGFPAEAQTAFNAAAGIWATLLTSPVPIVVNLNWADQGDGGILASMGPYFYDGFPNQPVASTWYPAALANKLAGVDIAPGTADIQGTVNSNPAANWYYGTDGNPGTGEYDLMSVALHELGHGLGFLSGFSYSNSPTVKGFWDLSGTAKPSIFGRGAVNASTGTSQNLVASFTNGSAELGAQFTNGSQYWNGTAAAAANDGANPKLYAPATWRGGSSMGHLDESTYPAGNANSLMTPSIGSRETVHNPGPLALAILQDIGWTLAPTGGAATQLAFSQSPTGGTTGVALAVQPVVQIRDASNATVTTDNATAVTLSLNSGGSLSCAANPVTAVNGVATFSGCTVTGGGTGLTLHAVAAGLSAADSGAFNVVGVPAKLAFTVAPTGGTAGVAFAQQPAVVVQDASGQQVTGDSGRAITLARNGGAGTLSCATNPASTSGGAVTFASCSLSQAGSYTLTASAGGVTSATTASFTVSAPASLPPVYGGINAPSGTSVTVTWTDNAASELGFGLLRFGGGSGWQKVADLPATAGTGTQVSFTDGTGSGLNAPLVPGTYYAYWVYAYDVAGDPGAGRTYAGSYMTVIAPSDAPVPPSPISAAGTSTTSVLLSWADNSSNESGFRVLRYNAGIWDDISGDLPAGTTSYIDTAVAGGTAYAYWIVAFNDGGTTYADAYIAANTPVSNSPTAPAYTAVGAVSATSVTINWQNNGVPGATGYQVIRLTPGGWLDAGPALPADATAFTDTGAGAAGPLAAGKYYAYWVYAFNGSGGRTYAGTYTTVITPFGKAVAPTPLYAFGASQSTITVGWLDNSSNETGFRVLRYNAGNWVDISTLLAPGTTSFTDTGRAAGQAYSYWVVSETAGGWTYAQGYISANTFP